MRCEADKRLLVTISPDNCAGPRLRAGAGQPRPAAAGPGLTLPQDGAGSGHRVKVLRFVRIFRNFILFYTPNTQIKKYKKRNGLCFHGLNKSS